MNPIANHNCSSSCTCKACQAQEFEMGQTLLPGWRQRRQQRLGRPNNPSLPNNDWEAEFGRPHQYFRERKNLRNYPSFGTSQDLPIVSEHEFGKLVGGFLKGQRTAAQQMAAMRRDLKLPPANSPTDRHTLAKLTIGDKTYYGVNAHGTKIFVRVNAISRTHAEGDIFNQASKDPLSSTTGVLFLDRPMCRACGVNGAVTSMAKQIGLQKLVIIEPGTTMVLNL